MRDDFGRTDGGGISDLYLCPWRWRLIVVVFFSLIFPVAVQAQWTCPPNINLEYGNLTQWKFYVGSNNGNTGTPIVSPSSPLTNRHVLTSGGASDWYGLFPVVDPSGGNYSLRIGNNINGAQIDQARYIFSVPTGVSNYSLIYRYAVVFEDPAHYASDQPYFRVRVYDSATGAVINCASVTYVSTSGIPGFTRSSRIGSNGAPVYYKPWSTVSINLTGQSGKRLVAEFTASDCALGGHFGYGYLDLSCGLFSISANACAPATSMSAPSGFKTYTWYNSNYTTQIGTGQTITVTTPTTLTQYRVVLTPFPGFGCQDTLTTQIIGSSLAVNAGPDTMLCNNNSIQLQPQVSGNAPPFKYSWSPSNSLSCSNCLLPFATPPQATDYILNVTDSFGCTRSDTVLVLAPVTVGVSTQPAVCSGTATGSATAQATGGVPPYTYSWSTTPQRSGPSISQVLPGTYTVTATDSKGCIATTTFSVGSTSVLNAVISSVDSVQCPGGTDGKISVLASGGASPYTYSWNTIPAQASASISGLDSGWYIGTVTDNNGCTDTVHAFVPQPAGLSLGITKADPRCFAESTGSLIIAGAGGTSPYQYALNAGAFGTGASFTGLSSASYALHLKDQHGCVLDTTVQLTEPPKLTVAPIVTNSKCYGDSTASIDVTANGGTPPYQYSLGSVSFGGSPLFAGLSAGSKLLQVRDALGCQVDTSLIITQPSLLKAMASTSHLLCHGDSSGSIVLAAVGGTSPYRYASGSGSFMPSSIFNRLGQGSYALHVKDTMGCQFDTTIVITEPAALRMAVTVAPARCQGNSNGSVSMRGVGGTPPYTYALNSGALSPNSSFNGLAAGTYQLRIRDANNCTFDTMVVVDQPTTLLLNAIIESVHCFGEKNGSIQVTVSGGTAPYAYAWTGTNKTGAQISGLASGNYTVTVSDLNGCSDSLRLLVTQPKRLASTTSIVAPICSGTATGSASVAVSGGNIPYAYSWNSSPAQSTATATALNSGTYKVFIADSMGCKDTAFAIVPPTTPMSVVISTTPVSCFGGSDGTATAVATFGKAPFTYVWNTAPVQTAQTAAGLAAGTYAVVATSADGCTAMNSITITQPAPLQVSVADSGVCKGQINGMLNSTVSGGNVPYNYYWNTLPVKNGPVATGLLPGNYSVVVVDSKGCMDSTWAKVIEYDLPVVDAGPAVEICLGEKAALKAGGALTYHWTPSASLSCAICPEPFAAPVATTRYTVVGIDRHGCEDHDTVTVNVIPHVDVAVGDARKICEGDSTTLHASGGIAWYWLPAPGLLSQDNGNAVVKPSSSKSYQVVVTENRCFTDTLAQWVEVIPLPQVELGPDLQVPIGSSLQLHADVIGATTIEWTPADGLSCSTCYDPVHKVRGDAQYMAVAKNELGCATTDIVRITDICDESYFQFANVFTPNADGQNDRFYPQGVASTQVRRFMIYDRWGEIVFSAVNIYVNDAAAGWDGTFKGQPLKPDVYVYVLDAVCEGGKQMVVRGDVTLIR